jgi:non-specific serine/threonine protein kinase
MEAKQAERFADLLKRYRLAAGLTQEALAERARVSQRAVSDLERGARNRPYRDTIRLLADALGLGPSERVRLEAAARRVGPPSDEPPGRTRPVEASATQSNLPIPLTSFVGREREMAEVKERLASTRLLTLTGAGGCGKTRLALQIAADVADAYPDGVWLVELAPLTDSRLVPSVVAAVLGVREGPGQPIETALIAALRTRRLVLLLDNCEHLIDACAHLANAILRACPEVRILATSRAALGIAGEVRWRVRSLALPSVDPPAPLAALAESEAIRLFVERAVATSPGFALTVQNATAVVQICRRLDGIPLALELAAARVKILTVEQIAQRLDDRFRLLTGGSRTALPRQRTLQAAMDWSYDLLSDAERALLRRLGVFAGSFIFDAIEAVFGELDDEGAALDLLDALAQLVDKSLVLAEEHDGEKRYRLLETVRQYAEEKLLAAAEALEARDRCRKWYLALAQRAEPELLGANEAAWLSTLEAEYDNFRGVLGSCLEGDPEAGLRIATSLSRFWLMRGYLGEGRRWMESCLSRVPVQVEGRASALLGLSHLVRDQGDWETAELILEQSLGQSREIGDDRCAALALGNLGLLATLKGEHGRARALLEESSVIFHRVKDKWGLGFVYRHLGILARSLGAYALARAHFDESLAWYRQIGHRFGIGVTLYHLAILARYEGKEALAEASFEQSLALLREVGARWAVVFVLDRLGSLARSSNHYVGAHQYLKESLVLSRQLRDRPAISHCLGVLGVVTIRRTLYERGVRLLGAAVATYDLHRNLLDSNERADLDAGLAAARAVLGEEAYAQAWAEGQAMTLEQAIAYALEEDEG